MMFSIYYYRKYPKTFRVRVYYSIIHSLILSHESFLCGRVRSNTKLYPLLVSSSLWGCLKSPLGIYRQFMSAWKPCVRPDFDSSDMMWDYLFCFILYLYFFLFLSLLNFPPLLFYPILSILHSFFFYSLSLSASFSSTLQAPRSHFCLQTQNSVPVPPSFSAMQWFLYMDSQGLIRRLG